MKKIYLTICLHNHQPVGNFDHVFEQNYNISYKPFLDVFEKFPDLAIGLHTSGPLWDWLIEHRTEYIDRIKKLTAAHRLEILGGAYYEPILAMIPEQDRIGQIHMMQEFIRNNFGQEAKGFWLAERVWEQEIVSSLHDAGVEYTLVDDSHFKNAGLLGDRLDGYYITEDHGKLISLFGTSEQLRYYIPFREVHELRSFLWETKENRPGALLVYGDDGEKFGGWPGTHDWVYNRKWLENMFTMLSENLDWIEVVTPARALELLKPSGKVYIPDSSYREMMEWALPADTGILYETIHERLKHRDDWNDVSVFMRGGFWRNFKYKYPEANQMYARMMEVSGKIDKLGSKAPVTAVSSLYKAQCNCPYWHGVFGGLYLNHLRFETYRNILRADEEVDKNMVKKKEFINSQEADFDFDGLPETVISSLYQRLYFKPHTGGSLYEWDYFPKVTNLLDNLTRRPEAYHKTILESTASEGDGDVSSIHDMQKLKDPTIRDHLTYDRYQRKSFIDHIFTGDITPVKLRRNECSEHGDLPLREYTSKVVRGKNTKKAVFTWRGPVDIDGSAFDISIEKSLSVPKSGSTIECEFEIKNTGNEQLNCSFGSEWNFAMLAGRSDDRFYFSMDKQHLGQLVSELTCEDTDLFGLTDEWQRITISFRFERGVTLYTFPIETVSQSESEYEKVYQSSVIMPVFPVNLAPSASEKIRFSIDITDPGE